MADILPPRRSLSRRLMWAFGLLTTLALLIQAATIFWVQDGQEEALIDEVVTTALHGVTAGRAPGSDIPAHQLILGRHLTLFHAPPGIQPTGLPDPVFQLGNGLHEWYRGDIEYHIGIRDYHGERYYLLYDASEHENRLRWLMWALLAGCGAISLLSLWLGHWVSGMLMRPLQQLAQALQAAPSQATPDATSQNPLPPLQHPDQDVEVALLAAALDDYRAHNARLIEREREFTANVSHELRTPLTRIRTGVELLAAERPDQTAPLDQQRVRRVMRAVDDLERRLHGLLQLARGIPPAAAQPLSLQLLVEQLLEPYREPSQRRGLDLRNQVPVDTTVLADPALLWLLLDNLLRNALHHTSVGQVTVHFDAGWLGVSDTGPGIPWAQQQQIFERHVRADPASGGTGLGLAIVRDIAQLAGWPYRLDSQPGVGTTVQVQVLQPA